MRTGYSQLLREHVPADQVGYGDCRDFQIVCPNCREAVFKAGGEGVRTHYLSHYRADAYDPLARLCELRVANMTRGQIEKADAVGRGQTLALFQRMFREAVLRGRGVTRDGQEAETAAALSRLADRMAARSYWRVMVRDVRGWLRESTSTPEELAAEWDRLADTFFAHRSPLWRARQRGFADDMMAHLLAPNSVASLQFIYAVAAMEVCVRARSGTILPGMDADDMDKQYLFGSDRQLRAWSQRALDTATSYPGCHNRLEAVVMETVGAMYRILLRIPYLDILRERAGLAPSMRRTA